MRGELEAYGAGLASLPELIALSKCDLVTGERADEAVAEWRERLGASALDIVAVSSATGAGTQELRRAILAAVPEDGFMRAPGAERGAAEAGFEEEHRVYTPAADHGFSVERVGDGAFRVEGRGIELLVRHHDLSNAEALGYVEQRLREIGVVAELRRQGFETGEEVRNGDMVFELDPA